MKTVVIGGGPGGYVAAIHAARLGAEVTLIEQSELGGTCLNRGCIPTKAILHSATVYHDAKNSSSIGVNVREASIDFSGVMKNKDSVVSRLTGGVGMLLKKNKIRHINAKGIFIDKRHVLAGDELIEADTFIIATGSVPSDLPFAKADGKTILNSDHIMALTELPDSLAIIGGGVIGCELAQAFARMGTKVTIIEMLPRLIANMDEEQSKLLTKTLKGDDVDIFTDHALKSITPNGKGAKVVFSGKDGNEKCIGADKVLVATGRRANIEGLGLDAAGVEYDKKRHTVFTDDHMRTNVENIYAIGDVTGNIQLAHVASEAGIVAADNIMGKDRTMSYAQVPQCIYTSPELASVGLSEESAKETHNVVCGNFNAVGNGRALIEGGSGFAKVVTDKDDGTILGFQLAGPFVTEMISTLAALTGFEATTEDMEDVIFAHPSVSEMVHEAILDANGMAIHQ